MRRFFAAAVVLFGCVRPEQQIDRRQVVVSAGAGGEVAWFMETTVAREEYRGATGARSTTGDRQRTVFYLCHARREPPCARFTAFAVPNARWFRRWIEGTTPERTVPPPEPSPFVQPPPAPPPLP